MNVNEAIEYIHSVCWKGSIPGLGRTQKLLEKMGNPEKDLKFIHIAGTNGKGSTAAMTASILRKAGYRTGLYTSPFLQQYQERIRLNGVPLTDDLMVRLQQLQAVLSSGGNSMRDAAAALFAIRPAAPDEE